LVQIGDMINSNIVETVGADQNVRITPSRLVKSAYPFKTAAPDLLAACKETLRQLNAPDCPAIPDGAMVRGRLVNAIEKAEGRVA
jgi:hypothetical protein